MSVVYDYQVNMDGPGVCGVHTALIVVVGH